MGIWSTENIKKLKEDILIKIQNDIKEAYFGNVEKLRNVCEVFDIWFSESNLTEALKNYTKIIKNKLNAIYDFNSFDKIEIMDLDKSLEIIYKDSPYQKIAENIINKLLFLLQLSNDNSLKIESDKNDNLRIPLKSKISEKNINLNEDLDIGSLNISKEAQNYVKCINNIIFKSSFDIDNAKNILLMEYIRDIIRSEGIKLFKNYYLSIGDLFNNTFGLLSSNGISCSKIKINSNEDFIRILSQNIKYIHEQIDNLKLNILNEPSLTIKKEEFISYIIKNLNLILTDTNILLDNNSQYKLIDIKDKNSLFDIKTIIRKTLNIIINEDIKVNSKLMKRIGDFIFNFRNLLSKLVKMNLSLNNFDLTGEIIESLLETFDNITEYDNNINLISSLLDIIYHISINIDNKITSNALNKGIDKLLSLILNSSVPQLVEYAVKIVKLFLKNSKLTKNNFTNLFYKLGELFSTENLNDKKNETEFKYNILIEMNSPEIDYQCLINALYLWEETHPTELSSYKKGIVYKKENELNIVIPAGKEISHFIPLKRKVLKTHNLEVIVEQKIEKLKNDINKINKRINGEDEEEEKKEEKKRREKR